MTVYHFILFLIVGGAPDFFAKLRPFLLAGSVLSVAGGFYQSWRQKQSRAPASGLSVSVLWISAVLVFSMIVFSQAIANVLASTLGD
jgi:hypothetical protein